MVEKWLKENRYPFILSIKKLVGMNLKKKNQIGIRIIVYT